MKAVWYNRFRQTPSLVDVADPVAPPDGVVIRVRATGVCRSDWHGWMGHDDDIRLPHVPGHEFAGEIVETGPTVKNWQAGTRVTAPFALGCGTCPTCTTGDTHICDHYYQPGFTGWGSFAEYVAIPYADVNLVALPESLSFVDAAAWGCRFITAYRAVADQGRVKPGEWLVVFGLGGVGLSAVMIGVALGARVIGVDVSGEAIARATDIGCEITLNPTATPEVASAILDLTDGGAHVSLDALGSRETLWNAVSSLRKRGRHVQAGLLLGTEADPPVPVGLMIARELELIGSHGMPVTAYPELFNLLGQGRLKPERLIGKKIHLSDVPEALTGMGNFASSGITVAEIP